MKKLDTPYETIRLAGIENESIVDGPGMRMTIFVQGCPHHCKGCHNPETHDFDEGEDEKLWRIINTMNDAAKHLDGITISGGEPFCQAGECRVLAWTAHELGKDVWCYSGFTFEELMGRMEAMELLVETDVLVDGRFIEELRTLELPFRGSSNQRLIDVKKSLEAGRAIEYKL